MNKETWGKIETIFDETLSLEKKQRLAFIEKQANGDKQIIAHVKKMLKAHDDDFMESSPMSISQSDLFDQKELSVVGHFKIIKKVATGGMGRVYLAQPLDTDVKIHVALKTIRVELISKDLEKRFFNEKQILSKLKHKNIASLIDAGVSSEKIPFIATEWVDGKTITDYCIEKKLDIKARLTLFSQVCSAVSFAHNKLIVHRDLKPDNILVDNNKQVKLLDFGIAKIIDENQNVKTHTQIFTPDYAAPEQINGESCDLTTDIYSLGVILFEILTNTKRFNLSGLTVSEKIKAICMPKAIELDDLKPENQLPFSINHLKGGLLNIINKAMHVDQNRRYQSVVSLSNDINNYLKKRPVSAMKDSFFYKTKMFVLRNKLATFLSALVLSTIIFGQYNSNKQLKLKLEESNKTQVMLEFFQNILASASPSQGGSTAISVKEMFKTGIDKYNFGEIKDPYIKAELSAQMGLILIQLDEKEKGIEFTNIALEYYKDKLNNNHNIAKYISYSNRIAGVYVSDENHPKVVDYLTKALSVIDVTKVKDSSLCESYLLLAQALFITDKEKTMSYIIKAEKLGEKLSDHHTIGAANYYKHALFYATLSNQDSLKYLDLAQENLEIALKGEITPDLVSIMTSKAAVLGRSGQFLKAEEMFAKASELTIKFYGKDKFVVLRNRANNIYQIGQFKKSLVHLNQAEKLFLESGRDKNITYHAILLSKAVNLVEFSRYDEAFKLIQQAEKFFSKSLPKGHRILQIVKNHKTDLLLRSSNNQELKNILPEIESYVKNEKTPGKIKIISFINLANSAFYFNEYSNAITYYSNALNLMQKQLSDYQPTWQYSLVKTGLALAKVKNGSIEEIERFQASKQALITMVLENPWYDNFFSID